MKNWKVWLGIVMMLFIGAMIKDRNMQNAIAKTSDSIGRLCLSSLKGNPALAEDQYPSVCACTQKGTFAKIGAEGYARFATVSELTSADKEALISEAARCLAQHLPATK